MKEVCPFFDRENRECRIKTLILGAPFIRFLESLPHFNNLEYKLKSMREEAHRVPSEGRPIVEKGKLLVYCNASLGVEGNYKPIIVRQQNCSGFPKSVSV